VDAGILEGDTLQSNGRLRALIGKVGSSH